MIKFVVNSVLEKIINHAVNLDPTVLHFLKRYQGQTLTITATDLNLKFGLQFLAEYVYVQQHCEDTPTTAITANSLALIKQLSTSSANTHELQIEGNLELAQDLQKTLRNFHIDWEEYLALFSGDVIAHQVCLKLRKVFDAQKKIMTTLRMNLTEYVQEEKNLVPTKMETEDFFIDISKFRNDVDRLEAKYLRIIS